jgi:transcriptional regulator with XRE-family HTH domain
MLKGNKMTSKKNQNLTLAYHLKKIRENLGKSQKEMASHIGISFRAWQGYELGKNAPGSAVIKELVKLGYNANWVLTGEGKMKEDSFFLLDNKPITFKYINDKGFDKHASTRILELSYNIVLEYQDGLQEKILPGKFGRLLSTLWKILSEQSEEWQTEEKGKTIMKALLKISDDFEIFRK